MENNIILSKVVVVVYESWKFMVVVDLASVVQKNIALSTG